MRKRKPELAILSQNLRALKTAWGMTEKQLGELVGAERAVVSNWCNQHNPPRREQMRQLEKLCGFDEWTLREELKSPNDFPRRPYQTIEISPKPRLLSEPLTAYGDGQPKRPLVETPGLDERLERIERLLLQMLDRLANIEKRSAE